MAIPGDLCDRAVVCNHYRLAVKRLSEFSDEKFAGRDVSGYEVDRAKLPVTLSNSDALEVVHPFSTLPHRCSVVPGRGEVCPPSRHQKPNVPDDLAFVVQDVNVRPSPMDMLKTKTTAAATSQTATPQTAADNSPKTAPNA